jgi:4-azaleucine resistance transporter AzlC
MAHKTADAPAGASAARRHEFWQGVRATFPLVVGAIPFGIIFGAVAVSGGLSAAATMGMSLFVFAGSAQFVAAGLVAAGAGVAIIVLTTFVVNLRHALYAASLAPHMKGLPHRWLLPLGFWLTDESYLVVIDRYLQEDESPYKHWFFLGSALFMYINWQLCTFIGIRAGQAIPNPESWGLEFALPVTFIGMLVPMLKDRPVIACVVVAGVSAVLFHGLPNQLGLIVAALLGVGTGALLQRIQEAA